MKDWRESGEDMTYQMKIVYVDDMDLKRFGDWYSIEGNVVNLYVEGV